MQQLAKKWIEVIICPGTLWKEYIESRQAGDSLTSLTDSVEIEMSTAAFV